MTAKTLYSLGLPTPAAGPEAWIGRVVDGRYRVIEPLGEGGMGAVMVAEHAGLGKRVALKLIRPEFAAEEEFADRFRREALATARLDHPNIAKAIDYGHLPTGGAYLVMQLVLGRSLESVIGVGERVSWREAAALGAQIAGALAAAHTIGIVHRDLKPDNVLVERWDAGPRTVKVLDFGVARVQDVHALGLPAKELTQQGSVIGTPGYMAPEQACGGIAGPACDLYALGVILWELLAGRRLWEGETLTDLFTRQLAEEAPPAPPAVDGPAPPALVALIARLLDREPGLRPASAREVELALVGLSHGAEASAAALVRPPPVDPEARRRVLLLAFAGVGLLVIVGLGLAIASMTGGAKERAEGAGSEAAAAEAERVERAEPETIPPGLAKAAGILDRSTDAEARGAAAATIRAVGDDAPRYLVLLAALEGEAKCDERAPILDEVVALGDRRALPALEALAQMSKALCKRSAPGCLACLRAPLGEAIRALD